jgi:hypothetical protein
VYKLRSSKDERQAMKRKTNRNILMRKGYSFLTKDTEQR